MQSRVKFDFFEKCVARALEAGEKVLASVRQTLGKPKSDEPECLSVACREGF